MTRRRKKRLQARSDAMPSRPDAIPLGAVPADLSQQVPNNSYDAPPSYYVDIEFTCRDCGKNEVWTAQQQKWYYEVAKGTLYATAVRCRECRNRIKDQSAIDRNRRADGGRPQE